MRTVLGVFRQPEFQLFLFCLMFLLFNWPFLAVVGTGGFKSLFLYLYGLWSVLIVLLFLIQKSIRKKKSDDDATRRGGA